MKNIKKEKLSLFRQLLIPFGYSKAHSNIIAAMMFWFILLIFFAVIIPKVMPDYSSIQLPGIFISLGYICIIDTLKKKENAEWKELFMNIFFSISFLGFWVYQILSL